MPLWSQLLMGALIVAAAYFYGKILWILIKGQAEREAKPKNKTSLTLTVKVELVPEKDLPGKYIWEATVAEYPDFVGHSTVHPYNAIDAAMNVACCKWWNDK